MLRKIKQELKQGKTLLRFGFLKATGQALGMIAPLVIAKFFSEESFGSYSLAKMIVFFFSTLLIASCQAPFIVFANQEKAKTGKINKTFSIQCGLLVFSIIAFLSLNMIFSKPVTAFARVSFTELLFMSLAFIGIAVKSFINNLFMGLGQRMKSAAAELVFGGFTFVVVLVLSVTDKINLKTAFLVYFVSAIIVVIIFIKTLDFNLLLPFDFDWKYFKDIFNFTKWLMFGAGAVYFINWGDNLVLRLYTSMGDVGTYNVGYQLFKGITMLTIIIHSYFLPFVSQHIDDSAKMNNYLSNKRPKILLLGLVVIGLLFVAVPYVFKLVYGDVYQSSIAVLRILLIGSVLTLYSIFQYPILNALKKYKFTQTVNVIQVLLNLLLDFLLVPKMGMLGAAVATVIAYCCRTVIIEIYFRVKLKNLLKL
jgi:O-antigen/teichoic acid export membrane protein